jgi:uncharacterized membrane protein
MTEAKPPAKSIVKKVLRFFMQGLLIIAPIAITVWAIVAAFNFVDDLLPNLLNNIFPSWIKEDEKGNVKKIPGLGFVVVIAFVIFVGWISSYFLMGSFINFFDQWMARTPVIKFLYTSTKDFFEAFAGDKRKFNKAVLANVFSEDVWIIGFLTDEEMGKFEMGAEHVAVYVPQAYNFAGQLYVLPKDKVRKIDKITSGEAMKYAVTGGVVDLDAERKEVTTTTEVQPNQIKNQ